MWRQESQRLLVNDFDPPCGIEIYIAAWIGTQLGGDAVVLPLLVGNHTDVDEAVVRSGETELNTALYGAFARGKIGVVRIQVDASHKGNIGQWSGAEDFRVEQLVPPKGTSDEAVPFGVTGTSGVGIGKAAWSRRRGASVGGAQPINVHQIGAVRPDIEVVEGDHVLAGHPRSGIAACELVMV